MFEPSKYTDETEKCIAFWKIIKSRQDIEPIKCQLFRDEDCISNLEDKHDTKDVECQTSDPNAVIFDLKNCPWLRAYEELKKRKLDKFSRKTTHKQACKMCQDDMLEPEYAASDQGVNQSDIIALNVWNPLKKIMVNEALDYPYDDIFKSRQTEICSPQDLEWCPSDAVTITPRVANLARAIKVRGKLKTKAVNTDYTKEFSKMKIPDDISEGSGSLSQIRKKVSFVIGKGMSRTPSRLVGDHEVPPSILKGSRTSLVKNIKDERNTQNRLSVEPTAKDTSKLNEHKESLVTQDFLKEEQKNISGRKLLGPIISYHKTKADKAVQYDVLKEEEKPLCYICDRIGCECSRRRK